MVHTSTSETYGSAQYAPIDERHPLVGQSPYSATKIAADKLAESYYLSFGLPVTILRPFNTFGPRQSLRAIIPSRWRRRSTRDEIEVGALDPVRDMNYVADTVAAFLGARRGGRRRGRGLQRRLRSRSLDSRDPRDRAAGRRRGQARAAASRSGIDPPGARSRRWSATLAKPPPPSATSRRSASPTASPRCATTLLAPHRPAGRFRM